MLNILDHIFLVEYDDDIEKLCSRLKNLKKESFEPNDRIIIWHVDTEYFYYDNPIGFTTHNLFTIIRELELPLFIFVFLTNYSQYQENISFFIRDPNDRPEIYNLIVNPASLMTGKIKDLLTLDLPKDIKFHAMCLLGTQRNHRVKLYQFLKYSGLDQYINFSFNDKNVSTLSLVENDRNLQINTSINNLIYSTPLRINESWLYLSDSLTYLDQIQPVSTINQWIDPNGVNFYRYYGIDIVPETVFNYPQVFISEKTLRPIALKTAFIMFGAPGTLRYLREHGFKTFNDFWNEEYDNVVDPHKRFLACCDVLTELTRLSIDDIKEMYIKMLPILEHNKQILSDYIDNVYSPLYNKFNLSK